MAKIKNEKENRLESGIRKSRNSIKKPSSFYVSLEDSLNNLYLQANPYELNPTVSNNLKSIPKISNINITNEEKSQIDNKTNKTRVGFLDTFKNLINKPEEKHTINKLEISSPTNFKFIQHIGIDGQVLNVYLLYFLLIKNA